MTPAKLQPAILGGVFLGVLSALPVVSAANLCCCLWIIGGGALASYLMQQNHPLPINAGDGALVGVLAGLIGAFVYVLVAIPVNLVMGPLTRRMFEGFIGQNPDVPPEVVEMMGRMEGGLLGVAIGFAFMIFFGLLFGGLGGILGAVVFRKNAPPPPPAPPAPGVDILPPV
jgi:hypothetical protein